VVQFLNVAPIGDGGQWDMAAELVTRYGLVPQSIYPESYNSSNSAKMVTLITSKVANICLGWIDLQLNALGDLASRVCSRAP
jgi:bleomycin hydrolase